MVYIDDIGCCGVGEVKHLSGRDSLSKILETAKDMNKGFLIVYFVKYKGKKRFEAQALMNKMLKHGFKKSSRSFINPNTGNTVQPLHYLMKKAERAKFVPHNNYGYNYDNW